MVTRPPLIIDGEELDSEAEAILRRLKEKLAASVALQDFQRREAHIRLTDWWMCHPTAPDEVPIGLRDPDGNILCERINWRWKLWAAADDKFPAGAAALMKETARAFTGFLPAEEMPDGSALAGGPAGGTSGPAELGIPVEWARKKRN